MNSRVVGDARLGCRRGQGGASVFSSKQSTLYALPRRAGQSRQHGRHVAVFNADSRRELVELWGTVRREPWDALSRPWRDFWAVKLAAAVVESDAAARQVRVMPVESIGLRWPATKDEAWHRARSNLVLYRQNYALCALALAFCSSIRSVGLLTGLASALVGLAVNSDRLLGELALASGNRFVWNERRVAGLDRVSVRSSAWLCALLCWAAEPAMFVHTLLRTLLIAATLIPLHAMLRPLDLKDTASSFLGDLGGVKSRDDIGKAVKNAGNRLLRLFTDAKQEGPVPIVVVQRGSDDDAAGPTSPPSRPSLPG